MKNVKDAMDEVSVMMGIPMNQLPEPAIEYCRALSAEIGFCGEVCVTAYAAYCQAVLKLPCNDHSYIISDKARKWFEDKGYCKPMANVEVKPTFELGQRIEVKNRLQRILRQDDTPKHSWERSIKEWVTKELPKETEVMVVGIRTLSNGTTNWEDEIGNIFTPKEYFRALLVVENMKRKPFYVNIPLSQI